MAPRTARPSAAEAQRWGDAHFVDRYDRVQLAALDRLDQLDRAATPLIVPFHASRVYRTEPTTDPTRFLVVDPESLVTRDTVLALLDLQLAYCADVIRVHFGQDTDPTGERRRAYVLSATCHGREVLDLARRIGRLPR